ncbi:MAG: cation transporter [Lentisphaerae bacterium]|nr:cation transporter [Lentisphaerota bacterium]
MNAVVIAQFGAMASAILTSACCWLPILLIAGGVSGGALAATFEGWRPVLLPVTFALLGVAFYFTYRKPKVATAEAGEACCPMPRANSEVETCCSPENVKGITLKKVNRAMLWVVTAFVLAFAFFPNYVGYLLGGGGGTLAARTDLDKVVVRIEGMTCEACATGIEDALGKVPGVAAADVSYDKKQAVVGIPRGIEPPRDAILTAIAGAGNYRGQFADQDQ